MTRPHPPILSQVDIKISQREAELKKFLQQVADGYVEEVKNAGGSGSGISAVYQVVTLRQGQKLLAGTACEMLLRSGSAVCVSDSARIGGYDRRRHTGPRRRPGGQSSLSCYHRGPWDQGIQRCDTDGARQLQHPVTDKERADLRSVRSLPFVPDAQSATVRASTARRKAASCSTKRKVASVFRIRSSICILEKTST